MSPLQFTSRFLTRMNLVNYEFKARLKNERHIRAVLKTLRARFAGTDHQVDTYFRVPRGRLKVRRGDIENALIFYERPNARRARPPRLRTTELPPLPAVHQLLAAARGGRALFDKRREIYFGR